MTSADYPNTDIVREIPPCGSLGGKNINEIDPETLKVSLTIKQINDLKLKLENLIEACMAYRVKERQAGVDAIHMLNDATAATVQCITPHRTVADAYDDAEEIEEMPPDPDLPLDIKVAKLPEEETDIYTAEELAQPLREDTQWVVDELRILEPHLVGYATSCHHADFAILEWCLPPSETDLEELVIFLNGKTLYWKDMTKDQFLNLLDALGAKPPKDEEEND